MTDPVLLTKGRKTRIRRTVIKAVASFGMTFVKAMAEDDRLLLGKVVHFTNARYAVAARRVDEKTGDLHVTFAKDVSSRKQRKGQPVGRTLVTNARYDRLVEESKEPK